MLRRSRAFAKLALSSALWCATGCDSSCEDVQEKLEECEDVRRREYARLGYVPLPIGVSDECNENDQCIAACVNEVEDCRAIVQGTSATTDPNAPRAPGAREFGTCIHACARDPG